MAELVSIITATYNNICRTKFYLKTLQKYTKHPFELIIIDNNSTDGVKEFIKQQKDIKLIENAENVDDAAAINQGMEIAKGAFIFKVDTDVFFFQEGWLAAALKEMKEKKADILGKEFWITKEMWEDIQQNGRFKGLWNKGNGFWDKGSWTRKDVEDVFEGKGYLPYIQGGRMLFKTEVFKELNGFDAKRFPHDGLEVDIALRALLKGFNSSNSETICNQTIHVNDLNEFGRQVFLAGGQRTLSFSENKYKTMKEFIRAHPKDFEVDPKNEWHLVELATKIKNFDTLISQRSIKASIIIYHNKSNADLEKTVMSCFYQDFDDPYEIIVMDDSGSAAIPEIIKRFDGKLIYLKNKAKKGLEASKQKGMEAARGNKFLTITSGKILDYTALKRHLLPGTKANLIEGFLAFK